MLVIFSRPNRLGVGSASHLSQIEPRNRTNLRIQVGGQGPLVNSKDDCGFKNHHISVLCRLFCPLILARSLSSMSPTHDLHNQILAIGFLLVILSCALFKQYLPLLVVATYVLAPLPNWICGRCADPDDFVESGSNAVVDFGKFCTGFLVVMGIGTFAAHG